MPLRIVVLSLLLSAASAVAQEVALQGPAEPQAEASEEALIETMLAEQASTQIEAPKLELFGFADFNYRQFVFRNRSQWNRLLYEGRRGQFVSGNLNVYLRGHLAARFTSLAEVRFHFSPVGDRLPEAVAVQDPSTPDFTDAQGTDTADFSRNFQRGSIEIERVYLEYNHHPLFAVRAGRFLTPYGVWNVDHGTPVVIDVVRPYIIGEALLPEAQTGIEVFGQTGWGKIDAGYHATVSNGRGPIEQVGDLDANKGLGGRLWVTHRARGELTLGASGYYGHYTDRRLQVVDPAAQELAWRVWERYRELGLAADVRYVYGGFLAVTELLSQQTVWNDDARPIASNSLGTDNYTAKANMVRWGGYGLVGYRFALLGLMPFVNLQYYAAGFKSAFGGGDTLVSGTVGVNARVVPSVVVKLVFTTIRFPGALAGTPARDDLQLVASQVAWAF